MHPFLLGYLNEGTRPSQSQLSNSLQTQPHVTGLKMGFQETEGSGNPSTTAPAPAPAHCLCFQTCLV